MTSQCLLIGVLEPLQKIKTAKHMWGMMSKDNYLLVSAIVFFFSFVFSFYKFLELRKMKKLVGNDDGLIVYILKSLTELGWGPSSILFLLLSGASVYQLIVR